MKTFVSTHSKTNLSRLQVLQNISIKCSYNFPQDTSSDLLTMSVLLLIAQDPVRKKTLYSFLMHKYFLKSLNRTLFILTI
ncbi:hypothetical protein BpHYR1_018985 [Brachionus plicatilis]|uniref:Uncharacterized protein n=1 Tax=Brachionus plicatilis TaxID=10195 RepID=A0A3M7PJB5_BRAPC|nr:hypothetical protein BpHYR1_018985 [Brachionus plicatilis]